MPPKRTADGAGASRGRPKGSKNKASTSRARASDEAPNSSNPFASSDDEEDEDQQEEEEPREGRRPHRAEAGEEEQQPDKTIPRDLLTRLLHEFFAKDATRISKDANAAVGKYVDVFVREAIARTAVEKRSGFLEVEDLEKVTPQLLLDL